MPTTKSRSRTMSSDSQNSRSGAVSPSQCPLHMDCDEEELSESQMNFYITKKRAFSDTMAKLEEMARAGASVTNNSDGSATFRVTETSSNLGPVSHQPVMPGNQQYRFVVDKSGRILGSVPGQGGQMMPGAPAPVRAPTPSSRGRSSAATVRLPSRPVAQRKLSPAPQTTPGKNPQVVDLTRTMEPNSPGGIMRKTFPALSVTAKPQKSVPASQAKRPELDGKVKQLLVNTPAKFTEWLIQQGLVRSEQYENVSGQGKVKLKLGMYSDGKKFPHSGGYVWIQEGSSNKYISVFRGSIFESVSGESQSPTVMLKLLYHWSCQTNIPNVANWVKVDNKKIDHFYKLMRSVCVAAVQDEVVGLGGPRGGAVEVGVISLGTTTADGQKREVRVEVLGIMDRATRKIRLRATEPIPGATQSERFSKIFETLPIWVQPNTKIVTDFSVDKDTLVKLGYKNVTQCSLSQAQSTRMEGTNQQIMEYLKKVVPKMFQNTLSNLSTPVIQQFLDELTFRELFANFPLACFDAIIQRISTQTSAYTDAGSTMVEKLASVSANPFLDWRFSEKSLGSGTKMLSVKAKSPSPAAAKRAGSSDSSDQDSIKKSKIHASEDHLSYKEHENVEPHQYVATDEPTQFPAPDERSMKNAPKKGAAAKTVSQQSAFAAQNLEDLAIYDAQGEKCCECGRNMTQQGHYVAYLCCTKCRYSSCCAKAMSEHVKIFHSAGPPVFDLGKSVILKEPMYCVCGYSAHSGMKLAKHIGKSGCQTAYPTIQEANKAKVERDGSTGGSVAEEGSSGAPSNVDDESSRDSSSAKSIENGAPTEPMEEDKDKEEDASASVETEVTTNEDKAEEKEKEEDEAVEKDPEEKESEEKEKEDSDKDEVGDDDKQPGPGGFLFGTFFNNMEKKDEEKKDDGKEEDKKDDEKEENKIGDKEENKADESKKDDEGEKEDTTNKESENTELIEDKNNDTSEKMDTE